MEQDSKTKVLQKLYVELQLIDKHVKEIQNQIQTLDEQMMQLTYIQQSILEMKVVTKGKKMLVALSNGIFAEATLADNENLYVNVGANVVVKKPMKDTADMMADQTSELSSIRDSLESTLKNLVNQAMEIDMKITKITNHVKKNV